MKNENAEILEKKGVESFKKSGVKETEKIHTAM